MFGTTVDKFLYFRMFVLPASRCYPLLTDVCTHCLWTSYCLFEDVEVIILDVCKILSFQILYSVFPDVCTLCFQMFVLPVSWCLYSRFPDVCTFCCQMLEISDVIYRHVLPDSSSGEPSTRNKIALGLTRQHWNALPAFLKIYYIYYLFILIIVHYFL
jgi:hypothetical protein